MLLLLYDCIYGYKRNSLVAIYKVLFQIVVLYLLQVNLRLMWSRDESGENPTANQQSNINNNNNNNHHLNLLPPSHHHHHHHFMNENSSSMLFMALALNSAQIIVYTCFLDGLQRTKVLEKRKSPETRASFVSLLTFCWFTRFLVSADRESIDSDDIWSLNDDHASQKLHQLYRMLREKQQQRPQQRRWLPQQRRLQQQQQQDLPLLHHQQRHLQCRLPDGDGNNINDYKRNNNNNNHDDVITANDLGNNNNDNNISNNNNNNNNNNFEIKLTNILFCMFYKMFINGALLNVISDLLMFATPYLLRLLLAHLNNSPQKSSNSLSSINSTNDIINHYVINNKNDDDVSNTNNASDSNGVCYLYVMLLYTCACTQTLLRHRYMHLYATIGLKLHSTLHSAIYEKNKNNNNIEIGEILNLATVDTQKLVDLVSMLNYLWSAPIQIGLAVYFLWQLVGPSVLAGVAMVILMLPVNALVAKMCRRFQVIDQMKFKDARIRMMNEVINGIKLIKLYAWEDVFAEKITKVRVQEVKVIKRSAYLASLASFAWTCTPFLVSLTTFAVYVLSSEENVLNAEKAFVALTLFNILRNPLSMLPIFVTNITVARVSLERLQNFLSLDDDNRNSNHLSTHTPHAHAHTQFNYDLLFINFIIHRRVNLKIKRGSLVAVVGAVGAGKSTFLQSLIGEVRCISGCIYTTGAVTYSSQEPWLQNMTIQENILFTSGMDSARYQRTLEACALLPDLQKLNAGDLTEVGDKGVTLSGGQKQRVSLARAAYAEVMDICLFDDPFSSVDDNVASYLFDKLFSNDHGLLRDKTRIIATNHLTFLSKFDQVVIISYASMEELLLNTVKLTSSKLSNDVIGEDDEDDEDDDRDNNDDDKVDCDDEEIGSVDNSADNVINVADDVAATAADAATTAATADVNDDDVDVKMSEDDDKMMVEDSSSEMNRPKVAGVSKKEIINIGKVSSKVFLTYLYSIGPLMVALMFTFYVLNNVLSVSTNIWLSRWSDDDDVISSSSASRDGGVGCINSNNGRITLLIRSFVTSLACCRVSKRLYSSFLQSLLRAPLPFFDLTPKGRILNRATSDVATLDYVMPFTISGFFNIAIMTSLSVLVIVVNIPLFLLPFAILLVGYILIQKYFVVTARHLRRLESNSRSHVFSHFSEALQGCLSTIRAFRVSDKFINGMYSKIDKMQSIHYLYVVSQRWLGLWLEFIGNTLVGFVGVFAVLQRENLSSGVVGLSIVYALDIIQNLNTLVTMSCELETNLVAVERLKEYIDIDEEPDIMNDGDSEQKHRHHRRHHHNHHHHRDDNWPQNGEVSFSNVSAGYGSGRDLVLKDLNFHLPQGQMLGIVGRTGSGKSSILMCLTRVLNPVPGGLVTIAGSDLAAISIKLLRRKITIIPQDPQLFSGSIRFNLDPTNSYTDEEIWTHLESTGLSEMVRDLKGGLDFECLTDDNVFSLGQKQLLCLCRALLRNSFLLILDESTASVDSKTEERIRNLIEKKFKKDKKPSRDKTNHETETTLATNSSEVSTLDEPLSSAHAEGTLIIVAHRTDNVLNCDKILVLEDGRVVECDSPSVLLADRNSKFYRMRQELNQASASS
ncbi:hypothetical protein HELRODRAFT_115686 [Helobdella robusta]|uniref:Uncharacterized protein n=1 Tax=Helobdella robusta TaxID=6412 RepID=T1EGA0_HELRO|nr:hypothetical protein HELRODRAFT_115686 [Helobdella robusta]ESN93302.1 hypothetical protein HELRODRAFT_115686 [Helobdella robusta]